mmetsp:Transcript_21890/g.51307  ORF Transcript_21890/g.51307 Transcript_21890/m.51307 type:complete len:229 (-) Transcript_21890:187-873(-)
MGNIAGCCRTLMCSLQILAGSSRRTRDECSNGAVNQHRFLDAAKAGNFSQVRNMLTESPELINCQPGGRWSALHHAAYKGNLSAVQNLLELGASTTLRTRDGFTPAEVAASNVFEYLLYISLQATAAADEVKIKTSTSCATEEVLTSLALWRFSPDAIPRGLCEGSDGLQCHICLDDFAVGDELRTLPCRHSFHARCVDEWLQEKSRCCPTCRRDITDCGEIAGSQDQ